MNPNRLSHSAVNRFQECPKSYYFHYQKKFRPLLQSAALLFGSAVDKGSEALVKGNPNYLEIFYETWLHQEINKVKTHLPFCTEIVYSDNDYDEELLIDKDIQNLKLNFNCDAPLELVNKIQKLKKEKGFERLVHDDKRILNYANWLCLLRKGQLMMQAIKEQVMPNIEEVLGTQVKVDLNNGTDSIIGYADLVCRWKGVDKPVVLDFKTSSRNYEANSVKVSSQLSLYVHDLSEKYEGTRMAGFIVLNKNIVKNRTKECLACGKDGTGQRHKTCDALISSNTRCNGVWKEGISPKVFVQTIISEIPEQMETLVLENFDGINQLIKLGIFTRNLNNCSKPYGLCAFYNICHNNSTKNLLQLKDNDK